MHGNEEEVEKRITATLMGAYQKFLFHYRKKDGRPLSYSTQSGKLVAVRGFFRWMARQNVLPANPAADLDLPRAEFRLPKHVMTATEAETVIATPDVGDPLGLRDRAILETLYATGMRRAEVTGLSVYDIDHERGTVRITRGKGDKERIIPIGERALAWITKYLDAVRPHLVVADSGDALFLTQVGDPFTPHGLLEVYRATHPAARIGVTSEHRKAREEAFDRAEAADLLTAVDDEDDEEAPVVNEALST
jgi:integrase/recombinase XerD